MLVLVLFPRQQHSTIHGAEEALPSGILNLDRETTANPGLRAVIQRQQCWKFGDCGISRKWRS
jgi:hypothetical protein